LKPLVCLEQLTLGGCNRITDASLRAIGALENLTWLGSIALLGTTTFDPNLFSTIFNYTLFNFRSGELPTSY
jgi:hypothetical protein